MQTIRHILLIVFSLFVLILISLPTLVEFSPSDLKYLSVYGFVIIYILLGFIAMSLWKVSSYPTPWILFCIVLLMPFYKCLTMTGEEIQQLLIHWEDLRQSTWHQVRQVENWNFSIRPFWDQTYRLGEMAFVNTLVYLPMVLLFSFLVLLSPVIPANHILVLYNYLMG